MSSPEQHSEPLDLVVAADGSGVVDAHQLARLGVAPGAHLSVVPVDTPSSPTRRRSLRGSLAHLGLGPSWEDFEAASEVATRDNEARYGPGGRWGPSTAGFVRVVADSHALVWYLAETDAGRLSTPALTAVASAEAETGIAVSVATLIDLW
jgi:hypothetical protein